MAEELDRERVRRIAVPVMAAVRKGLRAGPASPDRVSEALSALAMAAATVIAGTGDPESRRARRLFFDRALNEGVSDLVRVPPAR
jgi:hypothetical protein